MLYGGTSHHSPVSLCALIVSIVRFEPLNYAFNLGRSAPNKIRPIIVFVGRSRSGPSLVLWAKGKLRFEEWIHQSTEALGL